MAEDFDAPLAWTGKIEAPLTLFRTEIRPEWIDAFEHVNIAHYLTICDHANWALWNWINGPEGTMEARKGHEYIIVENHVHYIDEIALATPIHITTQLIGFDDKRYVLFHHVWKSHGNVLAATNEVKCLGFNLIERRPEKWQPSVAERLQLIHGTHAALGLPEAAGQGIALKRR
jgi:acyl-CoA thioester hydrolase